MKLIKWMIREEWRLHARIFGGWRFGIFPLIIFGISLLAYVLVLTSFNPGELKTGLHYAVFLFGINVGSVAFVSSDAVENLLGESSFLIFSSRTLPVSQRRVLSAFLIKDFIYYAFLYLIPIAVALVPALYVWGTIENVALEPSLFTDIPLLWLSSAGAFALGVSLSFLAAALYLRSRILLIGASGVFGLSIAYFRYDILHVTPLAFFENPSVTSLVLGFIGIPVLTVVGLLVFRPASSSTARSFSNRFRKTRDGFSNLVEKPDLVTKMLLDINRSSGDVWKIFFSVGVLFSVFVFMIIYIEFLNEYFLYEDKVAPGISFGVLLGVSAIAVYSWLNRFDKLENYIILPVSITEVLRAKFIAHLVLSVPVGYFYLALSALFINQIGIGQILLGALILPMLSVYVFGVTVYLTGLSPNEFLLDGATFSIFTGAIAVVVVPLFLSSFAFFLNPLYVVTFALLLSLVAGVVGYILYQRAGPKWEVKYGED